MSESTNGSSFSLTEQIDDYLGYGDVSQRRSSDLAVRSFLISNLKPLIGHLDHTYEADDPKTQDKLDKLVESTKRKLNTICQSLNDPTYKHEAFFKVDTIPQETEKKIYDLEHRMIEETENIEGELESLSQQTLKEEIFDDHFLHIDTFVDNINQSIFEREALILGDE